MKLPKDPKQLLLCLLVALFSLGALLRQPKSVAVVVTQRALISGEMIAEADLRVRRIDASIAPGSVVLARDLEAIVGKKIIRPIGDGEAMPWSCMAEELQTEAPVKAPQRQTEIIYGSASPESYPE